MHFISSFEAISNSRTLDYESSSMNTKVKPTRTRRLALVIISWILFSFSSSKARTPVYAGFLLNERWNISNFSLVYTERVHAVPWPIKGKGFHGVMGEGCDEFVKHTIISLVGPNQGILSGIGYLQSQRLSVPYIGIGLVPSLLYVSTSYINCI